MSTRPSFVAALMILCVASRQCPVAAAPPTTAAATRPAQRAARSRVLVDFAPAADDAPARVVVGGSRSAGRDGADPLLDFELLVPAQSYLSARVSPTVFWYVTKPTSRPMRITLVDPSKDDAKVYEAEYADPLAGGIQQLDLSKVGVKLTAGAEYKWILELHAREGGVDVSRKSIAWLKVLPPEHPAVVELAKRADPAQRLAWCAGSGLWYDFLAELQDQIARSPDDAALREWRDGQIGKLKLLAELEKRGQSARP
jgi:hypothetical protein